MRKITLKNLHLEQFKNHVSLDVEFGNLTTIRGKNGTGKSSIGDGVTWCLSGLDILGSKIDPQPTDRIADKVSASVLLDVDGKEIKFMRELIKGKATFYINDVPKKATEYNDVVYSLTGSDSVDLFLSLFNPSYFPSMHWNDQRNMILRYTSAPANSEVFKLLPALQSDKLKEAFKKNNIDDLSEIHKKNKTNKEKELIAAKSRVQTLEGQLEGVEPQDLAKLQAELKEAETSNDDSREHNLSFHNQSKLYEAKKNQLKGYYDSLITLQQKAVKLKEETNCSACKQPLPEESKESVKSGMQAEYKSIKQKYDALKTEFDALEIPVEVETTLIDIYPLKRAVETEQSRLKAVEVIDEAKQAVTDVQTSLNESIFILDAIKAFKGKESELQVTKVQSLFTTLSVKLWDVPKQGEPKPTFEITMDGKPYSKLSLGEKARAGLELIEVLSEQSGISSVCFIDNKESITTPIDNKIPQLIMAIATPETKEYDGKLLVEVIE